MGDVRAEHLTVAVTGDSIINRRISLYEDDSFQSLVNIVRGADVAFTHLETVIHDYDGLETYPAAEAGWIWQRSPRFVAGELKWAGFDIASVASNHSLDYSYGGLKSTCDALDEAGIVHAGTGKNLAEAREPGYLDAGKGRVALISMCSSFAGWARAGDARRDSAGRPGLNPLRYHHAVDADTLETAKQLAMKLGWWVTQVGETWLFNPPGLHNTIFKLVQGTGRGVITRADEEDVEGNLRSIEEAKRQADLVVVHLHTHEWDPDVGLHAPAKFVPPFARACIDAGADVFVGEGSHSPLRGLEIYKNRPIFYDPGDFISMGRTVTRLPADFYHRPGFPATLKSPHTRTADGIDALEALPDPLNPAGGYHSAPVLGAVVPVCSFEAELLKEVKLFPVTRPSSPRTRRGIPKLADKQEARKIVEYLGKLSAPFGTQIDFQDGVGLVKMRSDKSGDS